MVSVKSHVKKTKFGKIARVKSHYRKNPEIRQMQSTEVSKRDLRKIKETQDMMDRERQAQIIRSKKVTYVDVFDLLNFSVVQDKIGERQFAKFIKEIPDHRMMREDKFLKLMKKYDIWL